MKKSTLSVAVASLITVLAIITEWTGLKKFTTVIQAKTIDDIIVLWPVWLFVFVLSLLLTYIFLSRRK